MSCPPLDVTKSLFDSDGYRHTLIQATPMQIVTLLEGFYWLWDRRSGRCLIDAMPDSKLSNMRPSYQDLSNKRNPLAETRAFMLAQEAVLAAASSSWSSARTGTKPTDALPAHAAEAAHATEAAATAGAGTADAALVSPAELVSASRELVAWQSAASEPPLALRASGSPRRRARAATKAEAREVQATMLAIGLLGIALIMQSPR